MNIRARLITTDGCVREIDSIPEVLDTFFTPLIKPIKAYENDYTSLKDDLTIHKRRYRLKDVEKLAIYEEVL